MPLCGTKSWGLSYGKSHETSIKCLCVFYHIVGHGHKPPWLSKVGILAAHPVHRNLKSWSITCDVHTHCYLGRSCEFWVPSWLYATMPGVEFIIQYYNLSHMFQCEYEFSLIFPGVTQLDSKFLSEEIVLYVAVDSVYSSPSWTGPL